MLRCLCPQSSASAALFQGLARVRAEPAQCVPVSAQTCWGGAGEVIPCLLAPVCHIRACAPINCFQTLCNAKECS